MPKPLQTDECIIKGCDGTVEGEPVEVEQRTAYQVCGCLKCGAEWELGFNLYDKSLIREGTDEA